MDEGVPVLKVPERLQLRLLYSDAVQFSAAAEKQDLELNAWVLSRLRKAAKAEGFSQGGSPAPIPKQDTPEDDYPMQDWKKKTNPSTPENGLKTATKELFPGSNDLVKSPPYTADDLLIYLMSRGLSEELLRKEMDFVEYCTRYNFSMERAYADMLGRGK